jgi:hypothetical protein
MGLSWDLIHIEVLQAKSTILDLLMICIFSIKKPLLGESVENMFTSKSKRWMMDDGSENGRLTPQMAKHHVFGVVTLFSDKATC